jgi:protein-tyrosine phosphatase
VLLAHPERCPGFQHDPGALRRLVERGVLCSITSSTLTGAFGRLPCRFAFALLSDGLVHNIASDAHDAERRPPDLRPGLAATAARLDGFDARAAWLTQAVPAAILSGAPLPDPPAPLPRYGWRRRLSWRA